MGLPGQLGNASVGLSLLHPPTGFVQELGPLPLLPADGPLEVTSGSACSGQVSFNCQASPTLCTYTTVMSCSASREGFELQCNGADLVGLPPHCCCIGPRPPFSRG
jgi:hypothetical protein